METPAARAGTPPLNINPFPVPLRCPPAPRMLFSRPWSWHGPATRQESKGRRMRHAPGCTRLFRPTSGGAQQYPVQWVRTNSATASSSRRTSSTQASGTMLTCSEYIRHPPSSASRPVSDDGQAQIRRAEGPPASPLQRNRSKPGSESLRSARMTLRRPHPVRLLPRPHRGRRPRGRRGQTAKAKTIAGTRDARSKPAILGDRPHPSSSHEPVRKVVT